MNSRHSLPLVLATCVLGAGLVSACGSSSHAPTNIVRRKARATEKAEAHWVANVTGASGASSKAPSGKWHLDVEFRPKTAYLTTPANKPFSTAQLVAGNRLKFAVLASCSKQGKPTPGLYSYRTTGNRMTLTKLSDSCAARSTILTAQPWTKAP